MKITKKLELLGYKAIKTLRDCFGKWDCTIYENANGDKVYHQKYQGWYDSQGKDIII